MNLTKFTESSTYRKLTVVLGFLFVFLIIFGAGYTVGFHKAQFSRQWENNYYGNMRGIRTVFAPFMHDDDNINSHGAIGNVTSIDGSNIIIKGPYQAEQIINIGSTTEIRYMRSPASMSDIKVGEQVVAIGSPDSEGRITATILRIMPPAQGMMSSSTFNVRLNNPQNYSDDRGMMMY